MRKQNRNNRICTNEESGKTDFIIDPLLPIGKENARAIAVQKNYAARKMENLISEKLLSFVKEI